MLDQTELKLVLSTLSSRRSWLEKSLNDPATDESTKADNQKTLKVLDGAIKKLASMGTATPINLTSKPKTPKGPPPKVSKFVRTNTVAIADAHVLVAEDNSDSALLLQGVLEDIGVQHIDMAKDGIEASRLMEKCDPAYHIVLCDWDMPNMDGLQAIKSVKSLAKLKETHFIMVTAVSEAARIKEAVMNGAHDYIIKPVDFETLEKKIKAALEGKKPAVSAEENATERPEEKKESLLKK